jgi:hypothetical protein
MIGDRLTINLLPNYGISSIEKLLIFVYNQTTFTENNHTKDSVKIDNDTEYKILLHLFYCSERGNYA